jgi:hypothetical protein
MALLTPRRSWLVLVFAGMAIVLQTMDLLTGIRLMLVFGIDQEQNPIARTIFDTAGPIGLTIVKLGIVLARLHFKSRLIARGSRVLTTLCGDVH